MNQYRSPDPTPPSKTPIVIGAILALIGACTLVSTALLLRSRRTAAAPVPALESANTASQPSPRLAPLTPPPPREDDVEPAPSAPGTPRSSERARPAWAGDTGYAPQLGDPLETFLAASPLRGDVARAFVICRVQSFNKMDTFAGDDLRATVTFADTPARTNDGPEDANLAFVSAPLAQITHGDTIHFAVWDRDVFDDELITRATAKYDAGPLLLADQGASIECRSLEGSALDRHVKERADHADRDARALAAVKLDGRRSAWGWPAGDEAKTRSRVADVAALAGWDDPRTRKRLDALAAAESALEAQRRRVFDGLYASAKADLDVRGLHAHLEELACGARRAAVGAANAASPCVARLTLRNDGAETITLSSYSGPQSYVATAASGPSTARFAPRAKSDVAPKETLEVIVVPGAVALDAEPALLGVCIADVCDALRAR